MLTSNIAVTRSRLSSHNTFNFFKNGNPKTVNGNLFNILIIPCRKLKKKKKNSLKLNK